MNSPPHQQAMLHHVTVESPVIQSPRVQQVAGMFDLSLEPISRIQWHVHLPLDEQPWHVGLITGPSGCGKSTIARRVWPREIQHVAHLSWREDESILDAFPDGMSIKDITALLSAVGFSSPPAWLRPFGVLSTGEQFRVTLARLLAELPDLCVMDEYTSVVDRTVAQIGSAALAKTVRRRKQRFVAVTCHDDVEEWLQPDWVYTPADGRFAWRCLRRRPAIILEISRCKAEAWALFRRHHYLSHDLATGAVCFLAAWQRRPVAFSAWLPFVSGGPPARREHRTVTLPDYQGVGIGFALSSFCAALWRALGYRALSTTTHPAFVAARCRSKDWRTTRKPSFADGRVRRLRHATTRLTAGFEYVGPPLDYATAARLMSARITGF
ncbi:MAG TPA: ABC transporter ATP-binding protein [Gemmataceae bacterium]|nr:ABC transporter ATP-binding protein [Gemmataceae bacterium]